MFDTDSLFPPRVFAGVHQRRWGEEGLGLGESRSSQEGRREGGGVNLRRGVRGEENINRACCAEASCHGPLQEKD